MLLTLVTRNVVLKFNCLVENTYWYYVIFSFLYTIVGQFVYVSITYVSDFFFVKIHALSLKIYGCGWSEMWPIKK